MSNKIHSQIKQERDRALAQARKSILNLPPEKALEAIAEHPYPVTLIQSMAEEDFYFLVHRLGPDDAQPVLAIAANQQWEYLMDLEVWEKDQIDSHHMTRWLSRLLKADADRFTHWIANEQQKAVSLYLWRNIELHIREYEQDPGEIPEDFFSEDQTYYIRMRPFSVEQEKFESERDIFVKDLLNRLSVYDFTRYRDLLLASHSMIPAETEEELNRQRNVRLAEKGLLPFDEAIGVYQPLKADDLPDRSRKTQDFDGRIVDAYPLPIHQGRPDADADLFTQTLARMNDEPTLHKLQAEFAGLCNQVIAADRERIRQKQALDRIVAKVSGYISIGLAKAVAENKVPTSYDHANLVQTHLLSDIFRVGYGCVLGLKWRAKKWHHASWAATQGLPITFWGETFTGVLGGLLIKKPLFHDNYTTGVLYRDFATIEDIETTKIQLNRIIAFDDLLSLMSVEPGDATAAEGLLTYENLLLTLWANHYLNISGTARTPTPLTMEQFRQLFSELWEAGTAPLKISDTMREIFLGWLADASGLAAHEISDRMAPALEQIFVNIETELGSVETKNLDKRFITLFIITGQQ